MKKAHLSALSFNSLFSNHKTSLFPSEGAHITSRALLHANAQTEQKMDALLARAHVLAEKCKDSSVVWSDVCDGLHGEGARLIISFFLFVLSPPSVKITARARTRARLPLRTHLLPFFLRVYTQKLQIFRDRYLLERIRSASRQIYLSNVKVQDDKNQSKIGC